MGIKRRAGGPKLPHGLLREMEAGEDLDGGAMRTGTGGRRFDKKGSKVLNKRKEKRKLARMEKHQQRQQWVLVQAARRRTIKNGKEPSSNELSLKVPAMPQSGKQGRVENGKGRPDSPKGVENVKGRPENGMLTDISKGRDIYSLKGAVVGGRDERRRRKLEEETERTKKRKRPMTRFEEMVAEEMERKSGPSAEFDILTEKKLKKKLKSKGGKLPGPDDGFNDLLDGMTDLDELNCHSRQEKGEEEEEEADNVEGDGEEDGNQEEEEEEEEMTEGSGEEESDSDGEEEEAEETEERESDGNEEGSDGEDGNEREGTKSDEDGSTEVYETGEVNHQSEEDLDRLGTEGGGGGGGGGRGKGEDAMEDLLGTNRRADDWGGAAGGIKYVPPHLREGKGNKSEELVRQQRRLRGLLNRLAESNVESIASETVDIFHSYGRRTTAELITEEILGACCTGPRGNDQYAAVFAAFVSGMSVMIGIDVGANFVASLAQSMEEQYEKQDYLACRNLALLLGRLYTFGLLPAELMFTALRCFIERFREQDVAITVHILQSCGLQLRSDDVVGMKEFVKFVQEKMVEAKSSAKGPPNDCDTEVEKGERAPLQQPPVMGKRVQFMLDTICDIKNNKRKVAGGGGAGGKEEMVPYSRLKKWLKSLGVEEVQLRGVTWQLLLQKDKRGQWWLPSAAVGKGGAFVDGTSIKDELADAMEIGVGETEKMLQLAASQRMNTETRRAVFCIVMTGEDYIDSFEKLLRLKLPGKQDREVLRVVVECCLQEKLFNMYYVLLASRLCSHDHNHKFTLQYCLWDQFKRLPNMELQRSANLARFVAHVIASFSLSLSVLKAVSFCDSTVMTPKTIIHFRLLFETLLMEPSKEVVWSVFTRIAGTQQMATLRDGVTVFMHRHVLPLRKAASKENAEKREHEVLLADRWKLAKKAMSNVAGVVAK